MNDFVKFDANAWIRGGDKVEEAATEFELGNVDLKLESTQFSLFGNPVDLAFHLRHIAINKYFVDATGFPIRQANSEASKMRSTGRNYEATQSDSVDVVDRFWEDS